MNVAKIVIEPGRSEKSYWRDLWTYRELFYILSWRDIKVRYKQTVIGAAWSIIRPLLTTVIFTFVFSRVAKLTAPGEAPYAILVFAGMLPWQFFATALSDSSNSLIGNANLVSKVYFPRMIIPASSIVVAFVDFGISFLLLVAMFVYYGFTPDIKIFLLPAFTFVAIMASFGFGILITALNVRYRDFKYVVPFIIQIGLYITPVGFSSSVIPDRWRFLYSANPMVGVVDGFRWCILDEPMYWPGFTLSVTIILLFVLLGVRYFRNTEKSFADNI
jgi:lipopolysaccharide transport system permease protein